VSKRYVVVQETIEDITYWSDSMVTLNWIKKGEWRAFVGIRVNEICQLSDANKWCLINSADLISKGCLLKEYVALKWWEVPSWLRSEPSKWPHIRTCRFYAVTV